MNENGYIGKTISLFWIVGLVYLKCTICMLQCETVLLHNSQIHPDVWLIHKWLHVYQKYRSVVEMNMFI